jgi:ribosome recycling factor
MTVDTYITEAKNDFAKAIEHLREEYSKLQIGRASAALVETMMIEAYGGTQQLKAIAQITIPESRTISINAWDKTLLKNIETAIMAANIGLNPNNNGESILLNIPPMSEERRKDIVKLVHKLAEDTKIVIRQSRQKAHQKFKDMEKSDEISEDQSAGAEKSLQVAVDDANKLIDELAKKKENEVLTI